VCVCARSGQDRRAINVQLVRVNRGQSRALPVNGLPWLAPQRPVFRLLPKLMAQHRARDH
jgi:hypothetical protein